MEETIEVEAPVLTGELRELGPLWSALSVTRRKTVSGSTSSAFSTTWGPASYSAIRSSTSPFSAPALKTEARDIWIG